MLQYSTIDVWANPYTKDPISYDGVWLEGQPNGARLENCIRARNRVWDDVSCEIGLCALCYFPDKMNLTMRGLCRSETNQMEGYFDNIYFIKGKIMSSFLSF